ncbi:MAG: Rrf2 family transcriptional regulator [Candidatus Brocadiae bacterium]|nr:Rrf2 family transcriptional regulator [Candidatus Brocadiia bacterium]
MAIIKRETDYALRVLARLAQADDFLPVSALAEDEDVPELFLRKIMQRLHRAGMAESRQGPFGGYRLARPAAEISLLDVVETAQGPLVMNECFAAPDICDRLESCPLRARLAEMQLELNAQLDELTLADVVGGLPAKARTAE